MILLVQLIHNRVRQVGDFESRNLVSVCPRNALRLNEGLNG
jgi:hypothetical protein